MEKWDKKTGAGESSVPGRPAGQGGEQRGAEAQAEGPSPPAARLGGA